ncbi:TadE family type IV pilus minor pilin [Saccharopolyspora sp. TS4A08]|uniref:TadE family type IV pilus minor pilin n=1 Tax=Saccharopolyspora ipomoeae TaxID=3042027 RepID=A0ABT6PXR8_9PSEU|nr:TadE family type IV pilus minor pilin [Saccharopolyspora sp. TS4A08]MDI2032810.1 TadE family type IV pilus minor pilin [Saccharopolyspora sp. TS4A08]
MNDRGSVTVEAALGICSLVAVFGLLLLGCAAVLGQLRCQDAAVEAARLLARGDAPRAERAVRALAPADARYEHAITGDQVQVRISARWARAEAVAVLEPGEG